MTPNIWELFLKIHISSQIQWARSWESHTQEVRRRWDADSQCVGSGVFLGFVDRGRKSTEQRRPDPLRRVHTALRGDDRKNHAHNLYIKHLQSIYIKTHCTSTIQLNSTMSCRVFVSSWQVVKKTLTTHYPANWLRHERDVRLSAAPESDLSSGTVNTK